MNATKRDDEPKAAESSNENEAGEAAKRLRLAVMRIKKLRAQVKAGHAVEPPHTGKDW